MDKKENDSSDEEKSCRVSQREKDQIIDFVKNNDKYLKDDMLFFSKNAEDTKEWYNFCKKLQRNPDELAKDVEQVVKAKSNSTKYRRALSKRKLKIADLISPGYSKRPIVTESETIFKFDLTDESSIRKRTSSSSMDSYPDFTPFEEKKSKPGPSKSVTMHETFNHKRSYSSMDSEDCSQLEDKKFKTELTSTDLDDDPDDPGYQFFYGKLDNSLLDAADYGLTELPMCISFICDLIRLTRIEIQNNELTYLPNDIGQLCNLKHLDVSFNNLTNLPLSMGDLSNLQFLNLRENPDLDSTLAATAGSCTSRSECNACATNIVRYMKIKKAIQEAEKENQEHSEPYVKEVVDLTEMRSEYLSVMESNVEQSREGNSYLKSVDKTTQDAYNFMREALDFVKGATKDSLDLMRKMLKYVIKICDQLEIKTQPSLPESPSSPKSASTPDVAPKECDKDD